MKASVSETASRPAWRPPRSSVRLRCAAARKAEGSPYLRRTGKAVPQLLQGSGPPEGCDRRKPAAACWKAASITLFTVWAFGSTRCGVAADGIPQSDFGERSGGNIPSYQVKAGDVVSLREKAKKQLRVQSAWHWRSNAASRVDRSNSDKLEGISRPSPIVRICLQRSMKT